MKIATTHFQIPKFTSHNGSPPLCPVNSVTRAEGRRMLLMSLALSSPHLASWAFSSKERPQH